jgi:thiosulfate dehydrogenase [quinone] large subunit
LRRKEYEVAEMNSEDGRKPERPREGIYSSSRLERTITVVAITIASIGLGYLFFTQLWWKVPPEFGCRNDFTRGGLCFFIEEESSIADDPNKLLKADIVGSNPGPELYVPIGWATQLNGIFIDNVVQPYIRWFGYVIWGTEAWIFLSMCLGFFSRLGALAAIGQSTELMLGLSNAPNEWEWSYILMVLLSIAMFGIAPGRYFGLDRLLRPRFRALSERGSRVGHLLLLFT